MPTLLDQTTPTPTDLARMGKLDGLNLAGLVRMSHEPKNKDGNGDSEDEGSKAPFIPFSGLDINNRDEQVKSCCRYTEVRGGNYVYTYDEPDTSAWKKKRVKVVGEDGSVSYVYRVIRPVYEGALKDLKRGFTPDGQRLDGLIVYDVDRLTRDERHMEDAIEVVQYFHRPILDIRGSLDLLTDNGRAAARMLVTMIGMQSTSTSRRLIDSHAARAEAGIPCGGNRPFGWQADKRTLEPYEAALLLDAVRDIFAGIHIKTIVARWNKAGIKTSLELHIMISKCRADHPADHAPRLHVFFSHIACR